MYLHTYVCVCTCVRMSTVMMYCYVHTYVRTYVQYVCVCVCVCVHMYGYCYDVLLSTVNLCMHMYVLTMHALQEKLVHSVGYVYHSCTHVLYTLFMYAGGCHSHHPGILESKEGQERLQGSGRRGTAFSGNCEEVP